LNKCSPGLRAMAGCFFHCFRSSDEKWKMSWVQSSSVFSVANTWSVGPSTKALTNENVSPNRAVSSPVTMSCTKR